MIITSPSGLCMIKICRGVGQGVVTPSKPTPLYEQLLPLPIPCFKMFLERSLTTPHPHHPTSSIFHCYPLLIHHPSPPLLKILIIHLPNLMKDTSNKTYRCTKSKEIKLKTMNYSNDYAKIKVFIDTINLGHPLDHSILIQYHLTTPKIMVRFLILLFDTIWQNPSQWPF